MKLAIETGRPAFKKPLYVGKPIVEKKTRQKFNKEMKRIFDSRYFTNNGPMVKRLEKEIALLHKVRHCILACNGTIAQILALRALDIEGEVIVPSFTFIATAHACLWKNVKPIFCDIDPKTLMIDVAKAEKLINKNTSAIIGVHLFGNVSDVKGLQKLSKKHGLKLIFDAAHAFACSQGETPVGGFGNAEFLSFHATKFFSTFEGGAVLTNDENLAERIRFLKNFGFRGYDDVGFLGINGKMPESSAAMGIASLSAVKGRIKKLKKDYMLCAKKFKNIPGIDLLPVGRNGESNYQYKVILIDEKKFGVSRDLLYRILWSENVIARRYFYPGCHRMEPYNTLYPESFKWLPVTEEMTKKVLCLPSDYEKPAKDIQTLVDIIKTVHQKADEVTKWAERNL